MRLGNFFKPLTMSSSCCLLILLCNLPMEQRSNARETSWVVNAFVLATPISGPAWVKKVKSDILVRLDSAELHMQSDLTLGLIFFAAFRASTVSAVSPLCERVMKRVWSKRIGLR